MKRTTNQKINMQQVVVVILFVLLGMIASTSVTLAIFSGRATDRHPITFAYPVEVSITGSENIGHGLPEEFRTVPRWPGDIVPVNLGFVLTNPQNDESSEAYVRVKFESYVNIEDGDEDLNELGNLINFENTIHTEGSLTWVLVNFAEEGEPDDLWYLYVNDQTEAIGQINTKVVGSRESGTFLKGEVEFSQEIDRRFANKEFVIEYTVEASQARNVLDPIYHKNTYINENGQTVYRGVWQVHENTA